MEIWKDIPGYEGFYQASTLGNIKGIKRSIPRSSGRALNKKERVLKPSANSGYHTVTLRKENKARYFTVHRLIALTFLDHEATSRFIVVDHIDGDPLNNKVSNLQIITQSENVLKGKAGLLKKGRKSKYPYVSYDKTSKGRKKWLAQVNRKGKLTKKWAMTEEEARKFSIELLKAV